MESGTDGLLFALRADHSRNGQMMRQMSAANVEIYNLKTYEEEKYKDLLLPPVCKDCFVNK